MEHAILDDAATETQKRPRLVLVDGSGYIFRAYHALPPLSRRDGTPVGAVYGFTTMLLKLRESMHAEYFAVIFDASRTTFRNQIYDQYKANRSETPEDLIPQFPMVRDATAALSIPSIEMENYEADDIIAAYAKAAHAKDMEVIIVSSDKDLMQLIRDGVSLYDPMKNKPIGAAEVFEKFGVTPDKVIEVQSLIGDSVDNVPGVPSIGPKTAAELIQAYGDLEGVLANLHNIKQPKRREALEMHADNARLSRKLVILDDSIALPMSFDDIVAQPLDKSRMLQFMSEMGFASLVKKYGGEHAVAIDTSATPLSTRASHESSHSPDENNAMPYALKAQMPDPASYTIIRDIETLKDWIAQAKAQGIVAFDCETTSLDAIQARLVGISLALSAGKACYIPLAHLVEGQALPTAQSNLFDAAPATHTASWVRAENQLSVEQALECLAPLLADCSVLKIGQNIKYDMLVLHKYGLTISPIADTMLMSYVTASGLHAHNMDELSRRYLEHEPISFHSVVGSGKLQKTFDHVSIDKASAYAAEDADVTMRLYDALRPNLHTQQVNAIYEYCERQLVPVLVAMEARGIMVSRETLAGLSREFEGLSAQLEKEIHTLAGCEFSVGSPKQLGEVLFENMGIAGGKKSAKSGAYTTDAETLEILFASGHTIAGKVLEWRHLSKLQSTYTDALQKQINPKTGRVHTSYSMAATTTGRLSSSDPNLQNIPIRTDAGKRIRTAFVAAEGMQLISADYSQIELRLLAHVADMEVLRRAFIDGADIHAITASQMFHVPVKDVTSELRRKAKTINFGIIYGISAYGLAARLGISRSEAASYIETYFKQYPGIKEYMDKTIAYARAHGYVKTLEGRRIYFKDILSKNAAMRQFSERAAINAPLQGSAADIIKRAMVSVERELAARYPTAKLLLQVHDELVLEAPIAQAQEVANHVAKWMQDAANLSLPLTVETGVGANWGEIH